jgi:transposase InsO family protein
MSKARVVVLRIISKQLSVTEAAAEYGYSRQHVHRLLNRYREGGLDALDARSRRPKSNPTQTSPELRERIVEIRRSLSSQGLDNGPVTIAWHLERDGLTVPSTSTIRRILHDAGLVTPEPRKRPKSSYLRFEASQPNETWQSDFTHWSLADGTDIEILNWLDDHSRYLLSTTAHRRVTGDDVITTFLTNTEHYGVPQSTLTDNGTVYTARFTQGKNGFEYLLAYLGTRQKNGHPGHPQTQGKIERFHQTQKRWLAAQPPAATLTELQHQLDQLRTVYNEQRPQRALKRHTPGTTYRATPKAAATKPGTPEHFRLRYDRTDSTGKMSFRRAGRMHHLATGRTNARKRVLAIADDNTVTIIDLNTGEILSTHRIEPDRQYWRNQQKSPGHWPGQNL